MSTPRRCERGAGSIGATGVEALADAVSAAMKQGAGQADIEQHGIVLAAELPGLVEAVQKLPAQAV